MTHYAFSVTTGDDTETLPPPTDEEWRDWLEDGTVDEDSIRPSEPETYRYAWADLIGSDGVQAHYVVRHSPVTLEIHPELIPVIEEQAILGAVRQWLKGAR